MWSTALGARWATSRRACDATSSAPRRLRVNASVGWPAATNRLRRSAVSTLAEPRVPVTESRSGRCQNAKPRSAWGEPSSSTNCTGPPSMVLANSVGLPMVALEKQKVGLAP